LLAGAALAGGARPAAAGSAADDVLLHRPVVRAPSSASGSLVPVFVTVPLPMTAEHYIRAIEVAVPTDPIPGKGRVTLTPESGEAYLYTQARVDEGQAELVVTAECNRHGRFERRLVVQVLDGG
jgi:desulfoferrodoxin (superoxide reductase-like protein)